MRYRSEGFNSPEETRRVKIKKLHTLNRNIKPPTPPPTPPHSFWFWSSPSISELNMNDDYDRRRRCVKKEKEGTRDFFQCSLSQSLVVLIDQGKEDDDDVLIGRWFGREAARSQAKSRSKRRMGISCRLHPRSLISRHLTFSSLLFFFFHFNGLNDNQRKKKGPEQINNKRQNKTKHQRQTEQEKGATDFA